MSRVTSLRVQHIRVHDDYLLLVAPGVTVITGDNGAGKTSLIEALYIALQGKSFRGTDSEIVGRNHPWYRIDVGFEDGAGRTIKFDGTKTAARKQFDVDGKVNFRLLPRYRLPVVLFEPDDLRLLSGSPTRRRYFIDHMISQVDPLYHLALSKYERALKQRNNLLKQPMLREDELFVWNVALSEHGSYIIQERVSFIERLNKKLNDRYYTIAGTNDTVTVHYSHTLIGDIKQKLMSELSRSAVKDMHLGFTSVGPHRHDVMFQFNDAPAATITSRGEARSAVLAIKFIEAELIEDMLGEPPIILLDDVYSELDIHRQKRLQESDSKYQILITTTGAQTSHGASIVRLTT